MRDCVRLIVVVNLVFVFILSLSGATTGLLSELIYFAAFFVPTAFALLGARGESGGLKSVAVELKELANPKKRKLLFALPLVFPTVFLVALVSLVTSLLLNRFGFASPVVADAPLVLMLLEHALVSTLMEEMLFRLVPLLLLRKISGKSCIFYSSLFFALIHCNLFQIPYAFIAGAIFMIVDLACDSIIPSLIFHFVNNAVSVVSIKYFTDADGVLVYMIILGALAAVSLVACFICRKAIKEGLLGAFFGKIDFACPSALALVIPTLLVAITNLF